MTNLTIVALLAFAVALSGCAKDGTAEPSEAETGSTEGAERTTTTNTVEEWRAEEERPEEQRATDPGVTTGTGMTDPQMQAGAKGEAMLSDGEIAKITEVVNSGEIEQGHLASSKAKNPRVKMFAQHMISEHSKALQDGAQLIKQEQFILQDSSLATELANGSTQMVQSLRGATPERFDAVYMDGQVEQHQQVLDLLDKQLMPSADDPELKAELGKAREMVERHLNEAREIQQTLK